jgi:ADP-heptose:LPS heptosyltransferase
MKIWPAQRWGAVCRELTRKIPCRFVLLGGPAEVSELPLFRSEFHGATIDLVGKAGLLESFAVIGRCDLFLSSDTGLSKAAMAMKVPTVSVWGPVSPLDVGVIWDPKLHTEVSLEVACSPCVQMALRSEGPGVINFSNCGHHKCLQELTPDQAVEAILSRHGENRRDW